MQSLSPSANWSCAGVCGEVPWLGQNTTVCCVESCEYHVDIHPCTILSQMFVISYSSQRLHHLVGPLGVRRGGGHPGLPPHPGPPARREGSGQPLPGRLQAQTSLAGLLLLEEG